MKFKKTGKSIECIICNKLFYVQKWRLPTAKYCSRKCQHKGFEVDRIELRCSISDCNNTLYRTQQEINNRDSKLFFCSVQCTSNHGLTIIRSTPPKNRRTKPELKFMALLEKLGINYKFQYSVQWIKGWKKWYDFYLPDYNTLIEVDGVYWHGKNIKVKDLNEQQKQTHKNDKLKNKLAIENGYNLIRVWSDEIEKFNMNELKVIK